MTRPQQTSRREHPEARAEHVRHEHCRIGDLQAVGNAKNVAGRLRAGCACVFRAWSVKPSASQGLPAKGEKKKRKATGRSKGTSKNHLFHEDAESAGRCDLWDYGIEA